MADPTNENDSLQEFSYLMKHDWDDRARQDAKWFINTLRFQQSEEEFDQTGAFEVNRLVLADLPFLTGNRDPKTLRTLEIGCGAGRMTKHLASVFGEVVGVDVSGEMIRQAKQRLTGFANVEVYETNGVDFSFLPDQGFDLILSAYVFQHVPCAEVIRSNLEDGWRVLKPGGVFRFQTNAITAFDFEELEKDTWTGADFPESELRSFAAEKDAQMVSIVGAGSQYCWTTLRKRMRTVGSPASHILYTTTVPKIETFGRADDFSIKTIPASGDRAYLGLIVSGLNRDEIDANSLFVELNGQRILPQYVGPAGQKGFDDPAMKLIQVNQQLPAGLSAGEIVVRAVTISGEATSPVTVELYEPSPVIPKIVNVRNEHDEEAISLIRGRDLEIRLHVEGLDATADPGNTRVKIGQRIVKPGYIGFYPANGAYLVKAPLPADVESGEQELKIYFGNLESSGWPILIN
ncbi:MAG TPA: class I SAM-dependent methyltransferase [Blastocatellia bacterium]|nr:class I SAM-dependent methyltransferase [Blastocatellia bacterium]